MAFRRAALDNVCQILSRAIFPGHRDGLERPSYVFCFLAEVIDTLVLN